MYYFIDILYIISTVSSFSLEIDESVAIGFGLKSHVKDTLKSRSLERDSDSEKAALVSTRRALTHPGTRFQRDPQWHSVQSFNHARKSAIAAKESFSSDSDDESSSDSDIRATTKKNKKSIITTPKRTHKARYKSTRGYTSWTEKYDKGRKRMNRTRGRNKRNRIPRKKNIDRQDHNKESTTAKKELRNKKLGAVDLYIDNVRQILYNKTHYSPYSKPLHGTYDIGDIWSKQHFVKPFDENFKLPLPSNNLRAKISLLDGIPHKGRVENNYISLTREKNKPRNAPYVKRDKTDHDVTDEKFYEKRAGKPTFGGLFDFFKYLWNSIKLPKLNTDPGNERTEDSSDVMPACFPTLKNKTAWILLDNVLLPAVDAGSNLITDLEDLKNRTQDNAEEFLNSTFDLFQPWVHRVRDDVKISGFMNQILRRNQKIFDVIEKKSKDKKWKSYVRYMAKTYEEKFREFIKDTGQHKIKTRMGTERVVLNAVDVSNRILTRLFNFAIDEMDKNGFLLQNSHIPKIINGKLNEEANTALEHACSKLKVCRQRNGIIDYVGDVFTIISGLPSDKFQLATDALSAAVKQTDLTPTFGANIHKKFNDIVTQFNSLPYLFKIGTFNAFKNIVTNRNSPLVVYGDSVLTTTDKTVALLDVINTFDQKVSGNAENVNQWNSIKSQLNGFAQNSNQNIKSIMFAFVDHIKRAFIGMDEDNRNKVLSSAKLLLSM